MTRLDPIIAVKDVEASSKWYQSILGCKSMHGGKEFDVLVSEDGEILLCLHQWSADNHPTMLDSSITPGNGLILYFRTENLQQIRENATQLKVQIEEEIHLNTNSTKMEFSMRDLDGYFVSITEFHKFDG